MMRRAFFPTSALIALFLLAGCAHTHSPPADQALVARIDRAIEAGAKFMVARQSPDGAWRSGTYGFMKDGSSLTPHVVSCLYFLPQGGPQTRRAFDRGLDYLMALTGDGLDDVDLIYPVYTAAESSRMILKGGRDAAHIKAQTAWLALLRRHQLDEALGWKEADLEYGGWSFALHPPKRPEGAGVRGPWDFSNLSATIYGVAALRSAKVPMDDPAYRKVRTFVERCQNYSDTATSQIPNLKSQISDLTFDDGGFFFSPADALRNKAGVAGRDPAGRERYASYGSMTADGMRALLVLGLPQDHPRIAAGRRWLETHFSVDHNPGAFSSANEDIRDATYYYYCWSLTHALLHMGGRYIDTRTGRVDWPSALADALIRRQREDGSWTNRWTDAREDDPLVSTPFATSALAICRRMIAGADPMSEDCLPAEMLRAR